MVTCANGEYLEQEIKPLIRKFLSDRGLELPPEKTKITHIDQGFDFLGFNIRKYKGIRMLSPKIRGWANFFCHSDAKQTFSLLDRKLFKLLWNWAKRRHPKQGSHWIKAKYFKTKGKRHWVFSTPDKLQAIELPLFDATKITWHTKIKCFSNPYDEAWDSYFLEKANARVTSLTYSTIRAT